MTTNITNANNKKPNTLSTSNDFVRKYLIAAQNASAGSKIFPATILAAAALESGNGRSALALKYNNFFGIKADVTWKGKKTVFETKEQDRSGKVFTVKAAFRWYDTAEESFRNYVHFVTGNRYINAGILTAASPAEQFASLHKAGYATDINYVIKLNEKLKSFGDSIPPITKV